MKAVIALLILISIVVISDAERDDEELMSFESTTRSLIVKRDTRLISKRSTGQKRMKATKKKFKKKGKN